jgi:superfamily I DNA and/or RNA helicase
MMSPLSVSTYLPTQLLFDVVIFDEASQVKPCDALSTIASRKQLILVGGS